MHKTGLLRYDPQTKVAVASTGAVDRSNEVINQEGWDLKAYKKNPILLWGHDHSEPAIGKAKNIRIEGVGKKARLVFEPVFHEITEKARAIKALYEEIVPELGRPILNSFSVGFRPIEIDGDNFLKQELLEISAVNVPANADARMMAYKTLKEAGFEKKTIQTLGIPAELLDKLDSFEKDIRQLQQAVKERTSASPKAVYRKRTLTKVISKATDLYLGNRTLENKQRETLIKIIKRASEKLAIVQKEELNGKNSRTT